MSSVILHLGIPMIDAFNEYGHFFTVIHYENNSNYKKLAAQCFTNLYCVPDEFSQFKCILSFYPNRHTELLEDCPLVTYHSIERYEILKQGKGICDKIKELLNEGYYLTFYVDLFFLPCSESYQKNHLNHKIMVFGYDEEQMKFAVIDTFRNFKYAASEVSFDELETAFNSYEHAKNQRDNKVVYVKFQNQEVTIDITKLKKNLECFCKENEERGIVSGVKVYDELEKDYGAEKTLEIMKESNEHAPMFLRVENSKISTEEYKKSLEAFSINAFTIEQSPCTLLLEEPQGVDKLPFFDKGYIAVQDLAAQETAPLLELKDGDRVLDTCCAPGGKSAHILDICQNVKLVCSDVDAKRLESAKKNLLRLNRTPEFVLADVSEDTKQFEGTFDKILVDAPCSGTGVIRRHPDIKWLRRKKDIEKLIQTQEKILDNAFSLLNKGGILVYTTCSILKQENDEQIQKFLKRHSDAKLLPFTMNGKTVSTYQRLPGEDNADGFFYSRFIKE